MATINNTMWLPYSDGDYVNSFLAGYFDCVIWSATALRFFFKGN